MAYDLVHQTRQFTNPMMGPWNYDSQEVRDTELGRAYLMAQKNAAVPYAAKEKLTSQLEVKSGDTLDSKRMNLKFTNKMDLAIAGVAALDRVYEYHEPAMSKNDRIKMLKQIMKAKKMMLLDIKQVKFVPYAGNLIRQFVAQLHDTREGRSIVREKNLEGKVVEKIEVDKKIDGKYEQLVRVPFKQYSSQGAQHGCGMYETPDGYTEGGACRRYNSYMGTSHVRQCSDKDKLHVGMSHWCAACGEGYTHSLLNCPILRAGMKPVRFDPNWGGADYSKPVRVKTLQTPTPRRPWSSPSGNGGQRGGFNGGYNRNHNLGNQGGNGNQNPNGGGNGNGNPRRKGGGAKRTQTKRNTNADVEEIE